MTYVMVLGGTLAAGAVPILGFVGYKVWQADKRRRQAQSRRRTKIQL